MGRVVRLAAFPFTIIEVHQNESSLAAFLEYIKAHHVGKHRACSYSLLVGTSATSGDGDFKRKKAPSKSTSSTSASTTTTGSMLLQQQQQQPSGVWNQPIDKVCFCYTPNLVYCLPMQAGTQQSSELFRLSYSIVQTALQHDYKPYKVAFDSLQCYQRLLSIGIQVRGVLQDPRIAAWVIDPANDVCSKHDSIDSLANALHVPKKIVGMPSLLGHRVCKAVVQSMLVMEALHPILKRDCLYRSFCEIEMELIPVLAEMQLVGVGFRSDMCETRKRQLERVLKRLEEKAYAAAGHKVRRDREGWLLILAAH